MIFQRLARLVLYEKMKKHRTTPSLLRKSVFRIKPGDPERNGLSWQALKRACLTSDTMLGCIWVQNNFFQCEHGSLVLTFGCVIGNIENIRDFSQT